MGEDEQHSEPPPISSPLATQMEIAPVLNPNSDPSWFTPKRLLIIFCLINMLNYVDRGAIASNGVNGSRPKCTESGTCTSGSGIQGDFNLNYFEDGVLSSAFMVGLLVASPIFASLAKTNNPFRLIGVGLSIWTFAVVGCGCSFDFWSIAVCRMLVGVGEASFISLAAPFIDDNAPEDKKTAWLSIFYMCIPTGIALGYVYGGLVGDHLSWRYAFWGEAILMIPFAISGFFIKPLQLKGFTSSGPKVVLEPMEVAVSDDQDVKISKDTTNELAGNAELSGSVSKEISVWKGARKIQDHVSMFWNDIKVLFFEKVFVVNVLGYIAYNFVIGAYSYWGPKAGYEIYRMRNADLTFGGITIVCGIFGTLAGGLILDRLQATISNAFKLLSGATLLGATFCFSAFCSKNLYVYIALFSVGELCVFATQGPVNYVCLHCVKPSMRALSMAMSTVAIHIFGDVPSSPLVGVLQDSINNWRETSLILTSIFFLASGIWFGGIFLHSVDRSNEESKYVIPVEGSNVTSSLEGNANGALESGMANTELQFEMAIRDQVIHNQREAQRSLWDLIMGLGLDQKQIMDLAAKQGVTIEDWTPPDGFSGRKPSPNWSFGRYSPLLQYYPRNHWSSYSSPGCVCQNRPGFSSMGSPNGLWEGSTISSEGHHCCYYFLSHDPSSYSGMSSRGEHLPNSRPIPCFYPETGTPQSCISTSSFHEDFHKRQQDAWYSSGGRQNPWKDVRGNAGATRALFAANSLECNPGLPNTHHLLNKLSSCTDLSKLQYPYSTTR